MFVLDGLRHLEHGKLYLPQFHLGHLGFMPGSNVYYRYDRLEKDAGNELTVTPFQGQRDHLFLLKCVFHDSRGVVEKALAAFAALRLNIVSLESATIECGAKHALYCLLSWNKSKYTSAIPIDEGTRQKFIDLLPLLPLPDLRYLLLLQVLFLHCRDDIDHEQCASGLRLPKINMRLFDAFQTTAGNWNPAAVQRDERNSPPNAYLDLTPIVGESKARTLMFFSETETKALRVLFPSQERARNLLHIAFHHENQPGALLAISRLLRRCSFNILTSLLRADDEKTNVWETILEFQRNQDAGDDPGDISRGLSGVEWFRQWAFSAENLVNRKVRELSEYMVGYNVRVDVPRYPGQARYGNGPRPLVDPVVYPQRKEIRISRAEIDHELELLSALEVKGQWKWLVSRTHQDLRRRLPHCKHNGSVFLSIPGHCKKQAHRIEAAFEEELNLSVDSFITPNAQNVKETAIEKIRCADFFFGVWAPDASHPKQVSPWLSFEYGIAIALGKPTVVVHHTDVRNDIKRRIDPQISSLEYDDTTFPKRLQMAIKVCGGRWLSTPATELTIDVEDARRARAH